MGTTDDRNDPGLSEIGPDGMQKTYLVLSDEERAKGFVRPLRHSYKHVGVRRPANLRDLTADECARWFAVGYVKFEPYGDDRDGEGRFWTDEQLARVGAGCGHVTTMGTAIAETYARDPHFYGGTFCVACGEHYPVGRDGEFVWVDPVTGQDTTERVGT